MELKLRFKDLICPACAGQNARAEHGLQPDYVNAEISFPAENGRPARTVPIKIKHMTFEDIGDGTALGQVKARIPCIDGDHAHDIDISDLYRAPQLHLEGAARCAKGHKMAFERRSSWEYVDDDEFGGEIRLSGILRCAECASHATETLRVKAPDMIAAEAAGQIDVNLNTATRLASASIDPEA